MFFGTPHSGADPRGLLLHTLEVLIRGLGWTLNKHVLDALLPSSERLRDLRDDFGPVAQEHGWVIHSFQEQFGARFTAGVGGSKVVEDTSSYLGCPSIEVTQHIASNHMDMCRFSSLNDTEYRKVAAALERMVERSGVSREGSNSHGEEALPASTSERCRCLLEFLEFNHMGDRQANIKRAHHKTCKWFFRHQAYKNWMDENKVPEHNGVLWIRGNPGTGKSTLMKYLLERTKSPAKRGVADSKPRKIISFFFHARGNGLEKSTAGMYRHLIQQLLHNASDTKLLDIWSRLDDPGLTTTANPRWTIDRLKDLLQASILEMSCPITCFIDALDECDEYEIRDMLSFFSNLGEYVHEDGGLVQLCLSSRHYPHITIEKSLSLTLEGQEGHSQDIVDYLKSELHIGSSKLAQTIRHEMLERASGIFMWVVLVVQILNKEFDDGNIHALRRKLNEIPSDLHELFQKILTRDERNLDQLLLCIQWVLFSKRPLSPEELYFAILSKSDDNESLLSHAWEQEEITRDDIRKFIVSSSKGLVEVTSSKKPTAQFIHESVRDYLVRDQGLSKVWPRLGKDFSWASHDVLKTCCLNYINTMGAETGITDPEPDVPKAPGQQKRMPKLFETSAKKFPFLEYALQNIFHHSDLAQSGGVCQIQFLKSFPRERWIRLDNGMSRYLSWEHTLAATLLYILAEKNAANLIRVLPERFTCVEYFNEPGTERYGPPLVAAIAHGSHEAIAQLLLSDAELSQHCNPSFIQNVPLPTEGQRNKRRQKLGPEWRPQNKADARSMLCYLLDYAHPPYVAYFLDLGCWREHLHSADYRTFEELDQPTLETLLSSQYFKCLKERKAMFYVYTGALLAAVGQDNEKLVRLLLDKGADANSQGGHYGNALQAASCFGNENVVQLLLDKGADVNLQGGYYGNALQAASYGGNERVVQLLFDKGGDVNLQGGFYGNALQAASYKGNEKVVQLLFDKGADVNLQGGFYGNALQAASSLGNESVVQLLLDKGADINAQGGCYGNALQAAERYGLKKVVQILLDNGAHATPKEESTEMLYRRPVGIQGFQTLYETGPL
ncbi:hypothetical protein DL768_011069 [Monosporascus sp. mg162]|nr:hypothetical protein DL768_011069 [Monosporascus sp. mg162]